MKRRVAILGTASTWSHYPEGWEVWACSCGLYEAGVKPARWFEIHDPMKVMGKFPEYTKFLMQAEFPVYCLYDSAPYPTKKMVNESYIRETFGDWCLQSSISWMIAQAIFEKVDEIGLWGVDMSTDGEYATQRAGCLHLLTLARLQGISITLPVGSELRIASIPYPFNFEQEPGKTLEYRLNEVKAHLARVEAQEKELSEARHNLTGRRDEILRTMRIMNLI